MFIISDPTGKFPFRNRTNDIDTAADIIMGITGVDEDYDDSAKIMSNMHLGEKYSCDRYIIECVEEDEVND